jgi:hypothetical protein
VAKQKPSANPTLTSAAEKIGAALGQVVARLDVLKKDQASISAELQDALKSAQRVLDDLGQAAARGFTEARKSAQPKAERTPPEAQTRPKAAWAGRPPAAKEHTKPEDQRGSIRSKASRNWSSRQRGKG